MLRPLGSCLHVWRDLCSLRGCHQMPHSGWIVELDKADKSLQELVEEPLTNEARLELCVDVLCGLEAIHSSGFTHQDLSVHSRAACLSPWG